VVGAAKAFPELLCYGCCAGIGGVDQSISPYSMGEDGCLPGLVEMIQTSVGSGGWLFHRPTPQWFELGCVAVFIIVPCFPLT